MSQIIIGIPGNWQNRSEIVQAIVSRSGGFIFAGMVLMNTQTKKSHTLEIEEHNPQLQEAFRIAGGGRIPPEALAAIGKHQFTLYVLSAGASVDEAKDMMKVGGALLDSGGLAVKVESSGVAHSAEQWREIANSEDLFDLYTAFVTLIGDKGCFYSCGMHNFGLPDCTVSDSVAANEAAALMNSLNYYQVAESPDLQSGQTFSVDAASPRYKLVMKSDTNYEEEHPFHNPFGVWHLQT
jgi:hypothetical protein